MICLKSEGKDKKREGKINMDQLKYDAGLHDGGSEQIAGITLKSVKQKKTLAIRVFRLNYFDRFLSREYFSYQFCRFF